MKEQASMNLLKKLSTLLAISGSQAPKLYPITVQCNRCGEIVQSSVNMANDLSVEYDEDGRVTSYVCRKVLMGKQRCFQQIEVALTFDANRRLTDRQVTGGKFV